MVVVGLRSAFGRLLFARTGLKWPITYNFQIGGHLSISASNVQTSTPSFYDHNRGGAISGSLNGMYDFPSSSHVSMTINGNQVNCYDFESGYHISFNVNGNSVSAYDFADSCHYNYSVNWSLLWMIWILFRDINRN